MSHPLLERLRSPDPEERRAACEAAPDDASATLLVDGLAESLGDPAPAVSRAALDALVRIGRGDAAAEAALKRALRGEGAGRRFAAARGLAALGPPTPLLVPALVEGLAGHEGDTRWTAARLLVETGRLHDEVLGILVGLARADARPRVRRMAAFALRELAPDRPECAAALLAASRDPELHVRRAALTALASLLEPPPAVWDRLLDVLDGDEDGASRRIATVALGELAAAAGPTAPGRVQERLRAAARDPDDDDLRRGATRALARIEAAQETQPGGGRG